MADIPHFRVPLEFVGTSLAVIEQDTPTEIEQCVDAVTRYRHGQRLTLPGFGVPDPTFRDVAVNGIDAGDIVSSVLEWETRAEVLIEQSAVSIVDAIMGVALRLRATTEGASGG